MKKKLNKKEIVPGLLFKVTSEEYKKDMLSFGYASSDVFVDTASVNVKVGDVLETTSKVTSGYAHVRWFNTRTKEHGSSFWSIFKRDTEYMKSEATIPLTTGVTITSKGPFNGFDISIVKEGFFDRNCSCIEYTIQFDGTFTGGRNVTTKMIQEIKNSPGFEDKLRTLLTDEIAKIKNPNLFQPLPPSNSPGFEETKNFIGASEYSGGKISFGVPLRDDIKTTIQKMEEFITAWMKQKNSTYCHNLV